VKLSMVLPPVCFFVLQFFIQIYAQPNSAITQSYDSVALKIFSASLGQNNSIAMLGELCEGIGSRLTGSPQAAEAIKWSGKKMEELGFQNVHSEPVMVPHWIRGTMEYGSYCIDKSGKKNKLHLTALGGSVGTPKKGIKAEIIEIKTWDELNLRKLQVRGKIVFFNRAMDRSLISPGAAYGRAVDQRSKGGIEAAKFGAVAALVRSLTTRLDYIPHTGAMNYADSIPRIPVASICTNDADMLSTLIRNGKKITVTMRLSCDTLPSIESANVIGEIVGIEKPNEVVLVGAHLDSWDKGQGAHDDGAGCVHAIEALRLIKELGLKPKRTIRAVLFMNEENGLNGGSAYAEKNRPGEKHIAALESDAGGFTPVGLSTSDSAAFFKLSQYAPLLRFINADHIRYGGSGSDIYPLTQNGVAGIGLNVDGQRYFDYHHSDNDVISNVNERELALGSAVEAIIAFVLAQEGL
jgi:carboxypeptidase Q